MLLWGGLIKIRGQSRLRARLICVAQSPPLHSDFTDLSQARGWWSEAGLAGPRYVDRGDYAAANAELQSDGATAACLRGRPPQ